MRLVTTLGLASLLLAACSDDADSNNNTPAKDTGTSQNDGQVNKDGGGSTASYNACLRTCTSDDDCCLTKPCNIGMAAHVCSKGYCKYVGCKTDADCKIGTITTGTCKQLNPSASYSYGLCGRWCTKDGDCTAPQKCVAEMQYTSHKHCGTACTSNTECTAAGAKTCIKNTYCGTPPTSCSSDKDCTASPYTKCNLSTKACECDSDSKCQAVLGMAGGTYKCVKWPY